MSRPDWQVEIEREAADGDDYPARPEWTNAGVPMCQERCAHYDGKRCELLGHRPDNICEPAVIAMAARAQRKEW